MRWSSGRNKADEYEYSVPGRVSCCREACFSAAGTRKVACRDVGRTSWEPQPANFLGGGNQAGVCGYGGSPSPSSLRFRATWAWQISSEWDGLVTDGESSQVWGMVVPGCLVGEQCSFCICCICKLGKERIVSYSVVGLSHFLRVLAHFCMGEAQLSGAFGPRWDWLREDRTTQRCRSSRFLRVVAHTRIVEGTAVARTTHWRAVLATASKIVKGYRSLHEAYCCEPEPLSGKVFACRMAQR